MFDRILDRLRSRIRRQEFIVTLHADEEMVADQLDVFDLEAAVLTGEICERQKDSAEWKYRIRGRCTDAGEIEVIVKLGATGKVVFITVYRI